MTPSGITTESPIRARPSLYEVGVGDAASSANRAAQLLKVALAISLCALLAFGPLAFGAVDEWAICVLELGAALLLMTWAVEGIASGRFEVGSNPLFLPSLLFALLVITQLLPQRSAYWYATWQKGLLWCAFGMVLFVTSQTIRSETWLRRFGVFLAGFGFVVALLAIIQQFTWNGKIYWVVPNQNGGWVYGPYVNHAHYAGLMEMLVPVPLVFAMARFSRKPIRILFAFAAVIMASTIFLAQSVGGILAFAAELLVLGILMSRGRRSRKTLVWLMVLCLILAGWLAFLRPTGLVERLVALRSPMEKADAGIRVMIAKDSFKMVRQRPLLGWGLGTFSTVYPAFRSFYDKAEVNAAHNDFVQLIVETGIAGFVLMGSFLVLLYKNGIRGVENWRRDPGASMRMAALTGCTGLLIHGLCDFNLQIPGNAALFFGLAAIAAGSGRDKSVANS